MIVGCYLPQRALDRTLLDAARECEDLGYASVAVVDHVIPLGAPDGTPILECFTALAGVAAVTSRVRVLPVVVRAGMRPPRLTAHLVRTLRAFAGTRLAVGVGAGDRASAREDRLLGLPELPNAERRAQVRDAVAAVRDWTPDVPIWIGGRGPAMRQLAGEIGDAWNVWAARPEEIAAAAATTTGRAVPVTWAGQVALGEDVAERVDAWAATRPPDDRAGLLTGDPRAVARQLHALAGAGVVEAVVSFVAGDVLEQRRRFAREVLPLL